MGGGEVARYMSRHGGKSVSKAALISSVVPFMLRTEDNPHGTDDKTLPIDASARPAAKRIKQSKLVEYDGAAHGLFATEKATRTPRN